MVASSGRLTCAAAASLTQYRSRHPQGQLAAAQCFRHAATDRLPRRQTGPQQTAMDHRLISRDARGPVRLPSPVARLSPAFTDSGLTRLTDSSAPAPGEQRFVILSGAQETVLVRSQMILPSMYLSASGHLIGYGSITERCVQCYIYLFDSSRAMLHRCAAAVLAVVPDGFSLGHECVVCKHRVSSASTLTLGGS